MISVAIVRYLILQLADVAAAAGQPVLLLSECLPLGFLLYFQLSQFALLAMPDELELLSECVDFFSELLRLVLGQQVLQLLLPQLKVADLLLLLFQLLVLALQLDLSEVLLVEILLKLPVLLADYFDPLIDYRDCG